MLRGRVLGGEWSCAAGLIHGVGCPKCAQYMRQTVNAWPTREERYVPQAQRGKLYGWNEPWRGPILLQASWNGCQKPCCNVIGD